MTARSQDRDEAVAALLGLGWSVGRIRRALGITDILAHQLVRRARPFSDGAGCCHLVTTGRFCDAAVTWPGSVYCDAHHRVDWPQRASAS